jgi:hypothetical protein
MHKAEHHAGRLVEVKLASPLEPEEVQQFVRELMAIIGRIPSKYVGVVDLLDAHVFTPAVTDSLIQLLSTSSPRVERTALLIGDSATFALQVERVIRSANNENRRVFRRPEELEAWLAEVLSVEERVRLRQFMHSTANGKSPLAHR